MSRDKPRLEIRIHDVRAGVITNLPYDRNEFVFEHDYIADPGRPILSLGFLDIHGNLVVDPQEAQTKVPAFFSNLLPEGPLRTYLARRGGVKEVREFFLLWLLGADLPGAVIVQDADGRILPPSEASRGRTAARSASGRPLRFSLAGVQLKFSAVRRPGRGLAIPAEGRGGHWIVKLPSPTLPRIPENEFSMMTLAAAAGIEVTEVGLTPTNEIEGLPPEMAGERSNSLYVRRFDRTSTGARIHMEDFNQIYGQFPRSKYDNFSYGNMARDIWRVLGERGLTEFVRRLIFNAAIGNADMHLKNWSLIYPDGRTPQLSPAYDLVSTIQYSGFDQRMALSMAKEKDTRYLDLELLERFAKRAEVPVALVRETALESAEKTVQKWAELAADLPLEPAWRKKINEQLEYVPITRQFLPSGKKTKPREDNRNGRRRK